MDAPADPAPPPASPRRIRWRRWAPRAAFEAVLIVFSVVLALAVTGWAEDARTARRVEDMRGFLHAEMRANRDLLRDDHYLPHHMRLKTAFQSVGGRPDAVVTRADAIGPVDMLFSGGLHPPQLRDAVWTSVSSGDLMEHMEPNEVFLLARIYKAQTQLEELNRRGYESAINLFELLTSGENAHRLLMEMSAYLEDLTVQERELIALYDQALGETDGAASARTDDAAPPKR